MSVDRPLVLVGAGKMGGAMLTGWLASGRDPRSLIVVEPEPAEMDALTRPGLTVQPEPPNTPASVLVLAVKPQVMKDVLPSLRAARDEKTIVISIAAGVTLDTLASLGPGPLVRSIPNTPAAIGKGITAAVGRDLSEDERKTADDLLAALGAVEWVEEERLIDAATAVSGSGPAYVYHLVECMAQAGVAEGLSPEAAMRLARHTVIGAGALLERSDIDPDELRRNVTSPGGTTAAALDVLMDGEALSELMEKAIRAAAARARELA